MKTNLGTNGGSKVQKGKCGRPNLYTWT